MRSKSFPPYYSCRYEDSPVREWLVEFQAWLSEHSYNLITQRRRVIVARAVLESLAPLDRGTVFSANKVREMFMPYRFSPQHRSAQGVFSQFLQSRGQWIEAEPAGPCADILQAFHRHGTRMRGLSAGHMDQHVTCIRDFLERTIGSTGVLSDLTPQDVDRYADHYAKVIQRQSLGKRVGFLRAFFRYCQDQGHACICPNHIDTPRTYRHEKPPRAIPWEMSQKLLGSIDRSTSCGERDHAVLFLITHYGLRTGEITTLTLESIDWKRHQIRIFQRKTGSTLVLPMSAQIEDVLKSYLRKGRPTTSRPELFLSSLAPRGPLRTAAINQLFQRQVRQSELQMGKVSPYGLRHGFAVRLLEQGVGIKAIGDLLGHTTLESTSVYLRLHTEALRNVALPLPKISAHTGRSA